MLGMLTVTVYCALQDLGIIVRIQMFISLVALPMLSGVWLLSIFNFQPENMLPLWPLNIPGIMAGVVDCMSLYDGYEIVLLLLMVVARGKTSPGRVVGWSFLCITVLFYLWPYCRSGC